MALPEDGPGELPTAHPGLPEFRELRRRRAGVIFHGQVWVDACLTVTVAPRARRERPRHSRNGNHRAVPFAARKQDTNECTTTSIHPSPNNV